jgi:phosphate transport system substrate-binding protein
MKYTIVLLTLLFLIMSSCSETGETATRGNINIGVDESFYPLLEAEKTAFMASYENVKINNLYVSEGMAVNMMLADSVRMIIISRQLDTLEKAEFARQKVFPRSHHLATDAVCLITHPDNPDSSITFEELQTLFNGKAHTWNELFKNGLKDSLVVVFDKSNSSNLSFLKERLGIQKEQIPVFAAGSNEKVVEYVKNRKGALGIIGMSWISDRDSPLAVALRKKVRVMWVADIGAEEYFLPYQAFLANEIDSTDKNNKKLYQKYPLARKIYMITREAGTGPAIGFMNYMGSDVGQRIILKFGILPSKMPQRLIQIKP